MNGQTPISLVEPDAQRELVRERSKHVFGNRDRLEVAVAIACSADGLVNATDLGAVLVGWPNNRIRAQLVALAKAGLLQAAPRNGPGRVWYSREPSLFWEACRELAHAGDE
ncbi:MAG TPA: hypothetical protein VGF95_15905 [Solirubrobacteraceae bacterium]|jgi:hypothetical protein